MMLSDKKCDIEVVHLVNGKIKLVINGIEIGGVISIESDKLLAGHPVKFNIALHPSSVSYTREANA